MTSNKYAPEYVHVVHATEAKRRERYQGCVSRQTLRTQLRKDAIADIRGKYFVPPREVGRVEYPGHYPNGRKLVRTMGLAKGNRMYRIHFNLSEPR